MKTLLFPSRCLLCQVTTSRDCNLCEGCECDLPETSNTCVQCGEILFSVGSETRCGECLQHPPPFDRVIAAFFYAPPLSQLILRLKFHQALSVAPLITQGLIKKIQQRYCDTPLPQCLIPMPLHRLRLRERGYNQAYEITRTLAKFFSLPVETRHVQRVANTQAQSLLAATERIRNMKGAFQVREEFKVSHVAIVDDVVTTGSTVAELSHALRKAGVKKIDVWCAAKAPRLPVSAK